MKQYKFYELKVGEIYEKVGGDFLEFDGMQNASLARFNLCDFDEDGNIIPTNEKVYLCQCELKFEY